MKCKLFYDGLCALQNYENLLVEACGSYGVALEFHQCDDPKLLEKGSLFLKSTGELVFIGAPGENPIEFSWEKSLYFWSRESFSFKKHPLLRALGAKAGSWVVDATCGLAGDCSFLLNAGLKVRAYERFFPTYLLLSYTLLREAPEVDLKDRLELYYGNYGQCAEQWDCPVFYDPMFDNGSKRKAKANKEMTLFHALLKDFPDDSSNMAQSLMKKTSRLVVKRPPKGELLLPRPNTQWSTKAVRFDLYI